MSQLNVTLAITGLAVISIGLVSSRIDRAALSAPMLALATGAATGPLALGWSAPGTWPDAHVVLKEAARLTLAISVFGIAIRTPVRAYRRLAQPVTVLLSPGMLAMWAISAGSA